LVIGYWLLLYKEMLAYLVVSLIALLVAALTLFSGFGLGTLLMPAFALFFPVTVAVAATAVVHLANNLFKAALVGRHADWRVLARFAVPAMVTALFGAWLLTRFAAVPPLLHYHLGGGDYEITAVKLVIGFLIVVFALFDLWPRLRQITFDARYLPLGGALSGFFGGLSGNQGALRSAFLIKSGLPKEAFIGTGVLAAVMVDLSRLLVYGAAFYAERFQLLADGMGSLIVVAILAAFLGSFLGTRLLKKMTLHTVQAIVGGMLIFLGLGLVLGFV
jgi:uncharacterized protein